MNFSHGQLSALVTLITDATKVVEAHFAKTSMPYVPSLDDTEPHPLDIMSDSMELRIAIQTIEGACAQLSATVARPAHTILNVIFPLLYCNGVLTYLFDFMVFSESVGCELFHNCIPL
jgi:hypothetical protein